MSVMTAKQLTASIRSIKSSREKLQDKIHEALISASFYAMKDGNVTPFNQLLDAVGNATHLRGITMWAEVNAPVIIKQGTFALNKTAKKEIVVENEADFEEYENAMRSAPKWFEMVPQKVESIFDPDTYLGRVADKLAKEGFPDLATELRAVKGRYEMSLIEAIESVDVEEQQAA